MVARRHCEFCRKYVHADTTENGRWVFGGVEKWRGEPLPRGPKEKPPCDHDKDACPKGHYSDPVELSDRNRQAHQHYLRCQAVGRFPADGIVEQNAAIIRSIEDDKERLDRERQMMLLEVLLKVQR